MFFFFFFGLKYLVVVGFGLVEFYEDDKSEKISCEVVSHGLVVGLAVCT